MTSPLTPRPSCYDHPRYYEIAFSFRDLSHEVDVIQQTIESFAGREVSSLLQLGCGPCQHMPELSRRGLRFEGLDINPAMLDYSRDKAASAGIAATFHLQSMVDFRLTQPVDYVFIALGDLYVQSTDELKSLLRCVAAALRQGGLFLLDWCVQFEPARMFKAEGDRWEMAQGDVRLSAHVVMQPFDHPQQLFREQLDIDVVDGQTQLSLSSHSVKRAVYPQELLELVSGMGLFEFVGWWNDWNLDQPLGATTDAIYRPITLLRRV